MYSFRYERRRTKVYHNTVTNDVPDVPATVGDMVFGAGVEAFALWSIHWRHDSADLHATQRHAQSSQCALQRVQWAVQWWLVQSALWARAPYAPPAPVVRGGRDALVKRAPAPRVHHVAELQEGHLVERPAHQVVHVELCAARRTRVVLSCSLPPLHATLTIRFDTIRRRTASSFQRGHQSERVQMLGSHHRERDRVTHCLVKRTDRAALEQVWLSLSKPEVHSRFSICISSYGLVLFWYEYYEYYNT